MATRLETAQALHRAADSYWAHKGYANYHEIGIVKWGKSKVDVLSINMRTDLVVSEVKSCAADFQADDKKGKWLNYLPACNRMYFVLTEHTAALLAGHFDRFRKCGVGVLILCKVSGYLKCAVPAKFRAMPGPMQKQIVTRLAWRNGDTSKRTNKRRMRVFLD